MGMISQLAIPAAPHILPFPLLLCPLGGVTGRPALSPPYGNFFLSAGFKIWKEQIYKDAFKQTKKP